MKVIEKSEKKLSITQKLPISPSQLFEYVSQPHKMSLWLADNVRKTPNGFDLKIVLPLHEIRNKATIIEKSPPKTFEFVWNSEFVMDQSVVTFQIEGNQDNSTLQITEVGDFDESRWSDPQGIHIDLWEKALSRLKQVVE